MQTLTEYSLNDCVAAFNRRSPKPRDRRTVQRWLVKKGITGFGTSRHNWYYPTRTIEHMLDADFGQALRSLPDGPVKPRDSANGSAESSSRKAGRINRPSGISKLRRAA